MFGILVHEVFGQHLQISDGEEEKIIFFFI